jgi:hypothetical protein
MADAEENFWGREMRRRAEKKRAAEGKRAKRAGRSLAGLKKEAARQVTKNSGKLAEVLMEKALKGHIASAKLVVELAEAPVGEEVKPRRKKRGLSEAQRLALEPRWDSLTPEQQKQSLIRSGEWDFERDCRKGEWDEDEGMGVEGAGDERDEG